MFYYNQFNHFAYFCNLVCFHFWVPLFTTSLRSRAGRSPIAPTCPSSSGSPSTCPVNTPRQMRMELNWPMDPLIFLGEISPRYIGRAQRAIPNVYEKKHICEWYFQCSLWYFPEWWLWWNKYNKIPRTHFGQFLTLYQAMFHNPKHAQRSTAADTYTGQCTLQG